MRLLVLRPHRVVEVDQPCSELLFSGYFRSLSICSIIMREIVHVQVGQCGNQIGAKVSYLTLDTS